MREETGEQAEQGAHPFFCSGAMSGGLCAIGWQPLSQKLQVASIRVPNSRSLIFVYGNEATELVEELEEVFVVEKIVEMLYAWLDPRISYR